MRLGFRHDLHTMPTLEAWIGISLSMMPPCIVAFVGFWCFFAMLTRSTITLLDSGSTRITAPRLPMSLPASTSTSSPFFNFMSQHLRCERHDPHELAVAQLAADGAEDAGTPWLHLVADEHRCVLVEADVAAVRAPTLLLGANDDALHDVALLHGRTGHRELDGRDEDISDARVTPTRAAEHLDAQHLAGARVVGHSQPGFLLDHSCLRY